MAGKILFPQIKGLMHGGDYNPDQWLDRPDILAEDIRLMKKAGMTSATLGIFSWAAYEPVEGEYHFEWLKEVMDNLYANGIYTILATPTGARPAWMDEKYPECMRVDANGVRYHHGFRHNHCMQAPVFREQVEDILDHLIDAVGDHPGIVMWHINNELGGECFCSHCVNRFQNYLREKFHNDIEELNAAWWTSFWSHHYNDFSQVEPPYANGEFSCMGLNLEWRRFCSFSLTEYMNFEVEILRRKTPGIPITTNFMELYPGIDYRQMAKSLDVVSWDSYPRFHNNYESFFETMAKNSFHHSIMRSLKKDQPFMMMESAPGLVNWHDVNKQKRPGVHKLACMQAVACGSDTVQYFQWRKGRGSFEQFHGAVVDHSGSSDTRVFQEVAEVGDILERLSDLRGSIFASKVAIIFDWDTMWAIDDMKGLAQETKQYPETCMKLYQTLLELGVDCDIISRDSDFSDYKVIFAPMMYISSPESARNLKDFVGKGGCLVGGYVTGYVDTNLLCHLGGMPGDGLSDLFGIVMEEVDTLYPGETNKAGKAVVRDYAELIHVTSAEVLEQFEEDYYAGEAALTVNQYGQGKAYYMAARFDQGYMKAFCRKLLCQQNVEVMDLPDGVEIHKRYCDEKEFFFVLNHNDNQVEIKLPKGKDLLTGEKVGGNAMIEKYGTKVIEKTLF